MTESITPPASEPLDLTALSALEQAATPAPWAVGCEGGYIIRTPKGTVCEAYGDNDSADAALIVACRNSLTALMDRLSEYGNELGQVHEDNARLFAELEQTRAKRDGYREGQQRALRDREKVEQEMDTRLVEAWRERDAARRDLEAAGVELERLCTVEAAEMQARVEADGLRARADRASAFCRGLLGTAPTEYQAAVREVLSLLASPTAVPQADEPSWRDYSIHQYGDAEIDVAVLCRSDGGCEEHLPNAAGRYLTLGEAVDWAKKHVVEHVRWTAEGAEPADAAEPFYTVACPKCGAQVGEPCRGIGRDRAHVERAAAFQADEPAVSVGALIERSSLGTPEAVALRGSVDDDTARRIVARAAELADVPRLCSDKAGFHEPHDWRHPDDLDTLIPCPGVEASGGEQAAPELAECQQTGTCCTTCINDFGSCCKHDPAVKPKSLFRDCPTCGGEVRGVGVDDALTTTFLPCGHTELHAAPVTAAPSSTAGGA